MTTAAPVCIDGCTAGNDAADDGGDPMTDEDWDGLGRRAVACRAMGGWDEVLTSPDVPVVELAEVA